MSYVPATFTAGFALMLTVAGAVGGEWVSEIRQSAVDLAPAMTGARASHERQPTARAIQPAGPAPVQGTPAAVEAPVPVLPIRMKLREPARLTTHKVASADVRAKRLGNDVKVAVVKKPRLPESQGLLQEARFDASQQKTDSRN